MSIALGAGVYLCEVADDFARLLKHLAALDEGGDLGAIAGERVEIAARAFVFGHVADLEDVRAVQVFGRAQHGRAEEAALADIEHRVFRESPSRGGKRRGFRGMLRVYLGGEREKLVDVAPPAGADAARVADNALGVDENRGPVGDAGLLEVDAVFLGDRALRVEVGEERERDAAEIPRPVGVTVAAVDADARDSRIGFRLKTIDQRFQRRNFVASRRCPVERVEEQEDVVPPPVVAEVELGPEMGFEGEIRGFCSDGDHNEFIPPLSDERDGI